MKHSGKTHHGASLSAVLGWRFVDLDSLIQEIDAKRKNGMRRSVREIYRTEGEEAFRELETEACRSTATGTELVVATGGGICDNPAALEVIGAGIRVFLHDTLDRLLDRVLASGIPAFLHTEDVSVARERFKGLYERRTEIYCRIATITVSLEGTQLDEAERRVVTSVKELLDGGQ
jgi:shikimate kinase